MLRVVLLSVILAAVSAQHHVDPFAGSGCDCATFCSGKCAINATVSRLSCTRASCPYTTAKGSAQGQRYASSSWCTTCAVFVSPRLSGGGPVFADGSGLCRSTAPSCAFATIQLERAGTLHAGTRAGSDNSFTHSPLHYPPPLHRILSIVFLLSHPLFPARGEHDTVSVRTHGARDLAVSTQSPLPRDLLLPTTTNGLGARAQPRGCSLVVA